MIKMPNLRAGAMRRHLMVLFVALGMVAVVTLPSAHAASLAETFSLKGGSAAVDHSAWDKLLKTYVKPGSDGVNRVAYGRLKGAGQASLKAYIAGLEATNVGQLSKNEQFAFWVNLYNAKTVELIADNYPVKSIRDINISPGLFGRGPWGKKLVKVNGIDLSLDDIEHEILRPIWRDARIHYVVNCASIGCPNLQTSAFTGASKEAQLERGAREYINNSRGVRVDVGGITASKIYSWYAGDFGKGDARILQHIRRYAAPQLAEQLNAFNTIGDYEYDWTLNDAK